MEITKEKYLIHQELSTCSAQFLDFVKENPDTLTRSNFNALLSNKRYAYVQSQPWPTFINENTKQEMEEAAVKVGNLIKRIPGGRTGLCLASCGLGAFCLRFPVCCWVCPDYAGNRKPRCHKYEGGSRRKYYFRGPGAGIGWR